DQTAQDPALCLPAKTEQNEIVACQDRVDQLRDDGVVIADDAGKQGVAGLQLADQVVADFLFDRRDRRSPGLALTSKLAECLGAVSHAPILSGRARPLVSAARRARQ